MKTENENQSILLGGVQFLILSNDVICGKVKELHEELMRETPRLYRHEIKRNANQLQLSRSIYLAKVRKLLLYSLQEECVIADSAQGMEDAIEREWFQMNNMVFNEIAKKMKTNTSQEVTLVAHAVAILLLSRVRYDIYRKIEKVALKCRKDISELSLSHLHFCLKRLTRSIFDELRLDGEFGVSQEILNGMKIIIRKMLKEEVLTR